MNECDLVTRWRRTFFGCALAALSVWGAPWTLKAADPDPPAVNRLDGRIVDADGQAVAGARVAIADSQEGVIFYQGPDEINAHGPTDRFLLFFAKANGKGADVTRSAADGTFQISGLKSGTYDLIAVHAEKGIVIKTAIAYDPPVESMEIRLEPGAYVEGTISGIDPRRGPTSLTATEPMGNVHIDPTFKLNKGGSFRVGPLPAIGTALLAQTTYVRRRNFGATLFEIPVEIKPGQTTRLGFDAKAGQRLDGAVLGPKGEPLDDVFVRASTKTEPARSIGALTGKDGKYTITGLADGDYILQAKRWAKRTAPG